jgi:hypothetical protein
MEISRQIKMYHCASRYQKYAGTVLFSSKSRSDEQTVIQGTEETVFFKRVAESFGGIFLSQQKGFILENGLLSAHGVLKWFIKVYAFILNRVRS